MMQDPNEFVARLKAEHLADYRERAKVQVQPLGKRPKCRRCGRELRLYRWRKVGSARLYGTYGDNTFCGLSCGYQYAIAKVGGSKP